MSRALNLGHPSPLDLGFQSEGVARQFPIPNQIASQFLTLQGAVAHTDMPITSGPTLLLPYSQHFEYGYMAYRRPEFQEIFHRSSVQLELKRGDGLFFNPALVHAAGDNRTNRDQRTANLLQVSAGWGKTMEHVDRSKLLLCTWPHIRHLLDSEGGVVKSPRVQAVVKAIADGYSFPTNLDKDPPPASGVSLAEYLPQFAFPLTSIYSIPREFPALPRHATGLDIYRPARAVVTKPIGARNLGQRCETMQRLA